MQLTKRVESDRITETEYRKIRERLSYSSIKLFDNDRKKFYEECVMGIKKVEKQSVSLVLGSLVHLLLGNPDEFDQKFHIAQVTKPKGQMGQLVDNLFARTLQSAEVVDGKLVQQDSFPTLFADAVQRTKYSFEGEEIAFMKKDEAKILSMFEADGQLYYDELLNTVGKTVVSIPTIDQAEKLVNRLKAHPYTAELANLQSGTDVECFNELPSPCVALSPYRSKQ